MPKEYSITSRGVGRIEVLTDTLSKIDGDDPRWSPTLAEVQVLEYLNSGRQFSDSEVPLKVKGYPEILTRLQKGRYIISRGH